MLAKNADAMAMDRAAEYASRQKATLAKGIDYKSAIGGYGLFVGPEDGDYFSNLRKNTTKDKEERSSAEKEAEKYEKLWNISSKNAKEMFYRRELPHWMSDYDAARLALDDKRAYEMLRNEGFAPGNIPDDVIIGMLEQRERERWARKEYLIGLKPKSSIREYVSNGLSKLGKMLKLKR